jgi:hypothetical protein
MSVQQMSETYLNQYRWIKDGDNIDWLPMTSEHVFATYNGKITTQADAGDYNATNRTDALVEALTEAKKVLIKPKNGTVSLELRFRSDGSALDDSIVQLFGAAGVDHYIHMAQLTVTQGTQIDSGSIYFCDGITPANEIWITAASELTTTNNYIGRYVFNTHGYDRFWIVANDLDTTTLYVDWRRH